MSFFSTSSQVNNNSGRGDHLNSNPNNTGSFLGFRTHGEFTNGICDIFATTNYIQDGREVQEQMWKCTPLCLNSLFCTYCMLSRQAHVIYLDEAYMYYDNHQRQFSNHSLGIHSSNPADFNHVPVLSNQSQNGGDGSASVASSKRTGGGGAVGGRQPIMGHVHGSGLTLGSTLAGGQGGINNNQSQYSHQNSHFSGNFNNNDDDTSNSFCPCCPYSCRTCLPRLQVCLDTTLLPTCHWTCISAVSIDIANIIVGGFIPVTFSGLWFSGLAMQALLTRHLVRKRLGLASETLQDMFVAMCLPCCAVGQQHMEMEMRRQRAGLRDYEGLIFGQWSAPMPRRGMDSMIY